MHVRRQSEWEDEACKLRLQIITGRLKALRKDDEDCQELE